MNVKAIGAFGNDWNPVSTSLRGENWATSKAAPSMSAFRSRTGIAGALGPLQLQWEVLQGKRRGNKMLSLAVRCLRRLVKADAIQVLPADVDVFCATFLAPPAFVSGTIPRVFFIYDIIPFRLPEQCGPMQRGMLESMLAAMDPKRDVAVAISEFTKADFCAYSGFPSERVFVAPLAASRAFKPIDDREQLRRVRSRYRIGPTAYMLCVANPQPRKNLDRIVRAFFRFVREVPEWGGVLVLAGNAAHGWRSEELAKVIASEPALEHRICQIGPVDEDDLAPLYSGSECFIFPSMYEGFGLPVLEAMQCGAPVICSNNTSVVEVAESAALLVDPTSDADLLKAMASIVRHPEMRSDLSLRGISRSRQFSWERTAAGVSAAIEYAVKTRVQTNL